MAVRMNARSATLEVRVTNIPAQELYRKFGFDIIAIRKKFYSDTGEDAYVMWIYDLKKELKKIQALIKGIQGDRDEEE